MRSFVNGAISVRSVSPNAAPQLSAGVGKGRSSGCALGSPQCHVPATPWKSHVLLNWQSPRARPKIWPTRDKEADKEAAKEIRRLPQSLRRSRGTSPWTWPGREPCRAAPAPSFADRPPRVGAISGVYHLSAAPNEAIQMFSSLSYFSSLNCAISVEAGQGNGKPSIKTTTVFAPICALPLAVITDI